ncbi:MAG: hypothetical protein ACK6EB_21650 [Planctomyces sp.]
MGALFLQDFAVSLNQQFDSFADSFSERGGEFGLAFAAVQYGCQQRCILTISRGCPGAGAEQCAEGIDLRRQLSLFKPQFGIPFTPGIEVQAGEDQPPLASVGEQGESFAAGAEPLDDQAGGAASASDADLFFAVEEDRQQ